MKCKATVGKHLIRFFMLTLVASWTRLLARSYITDTEIELYIRAVDPRFQSAGLSPAAVDIYFINEDTSMPLLLAVRTYFSILDY